MAIEYSWAPPEDGRLYGGLRIDRIDGPDKATGRAQKTQMVHIWRIVNGKAARFQQHADTLQVARVTGVQ